jgi:predicted  nucleic acid-binding Zn-ribbon protein
MESHDAAEARMSELEPQVAKLREERDEKLAAFEREVAVQGEELERCRRERERLLAELPKQTSAMYNRIVTRIRGGVAVAEARNGSCTECFMALRPQVMAQIRRGDEIIICDNCNRILYYAPAVEQAHAVS